MWGIAGLLHQAIVGAPATPDPESGSASGSSASSRTSVTAGRPVTIAVPAPLRTRRRVPPAVAQLIDASLRLDPAARPTIPVLASTLAAALECTPVPFG